MAYQIQYGQTVTRVEFDERKQRGKSGFIQKLIVVIVALICIYALKTCVDHDILIPGNKQITKAAFSELTEDMKEGRPFVPAFSDFCRKVVQKDDLA